MSQNKIAIFTSYCTVSAVAGEIGSYEGDQILSNSVYIISDTHCLHYKHLELLSQVLIVRLPVNNYSDIYYTLINILIQKYKVMK
jgi:hypothetical protein